MAEPQAVQNTPVRAQPKYDFEWYDKTFTNKDSKSPQGLYEFMISNQYTKEAFEKAGITRNNFKQKFDAALRDTYPTTGRPIAFFIAVSEEMSAVRGTMELPVGAANIDHRFAVKILQEMKDTGTNFGISRDKDRNIKFSGIARLKIDDGVMPNSKSIVLDFDKETIDPQIRVNDTATFKPENYKRVRTTDVQEFFSHYLTKGRDNETLIVEHEGKFQINPKVTIAPKGINMAISQDLYDSKKGEFNITPAVSSLLAHEIIHGLYISDEPFRKQANALFLKWNSKTLIYGG